MKQNNSLQNNSLNDKNVKNSEVVFKMIKAMIKTFAVTAFLALFILSILPAVLAERENNGNMINENEMNENRINPESPAASGEVYNVISGNEVITGNADELNEIETEPPEAKQPNNERGLNYFWTQQGEQKEQFRSEMSEKREEVKENIREQREEFKEERKELRDEFKDEERFPREESRTERAEAAESGGYFAEGFSSEKARKDALHQFKEMKEKFKNNEEKYEFIKEEQEKFKETYREHKQELIKIKEEAKLCTEDDTEDAEKCRSKKSELKRGVKMHLLKTGDVIEKSLEKLLNRLESSKTLAEQEKEEAIAKVKGMEEKLQAELGKIESLSENMTKEEMQTAIQNLKQLWQEVRNEQRKLVNSLLAGKQEKLVE